MGRPPSIEPWLPDAIDWMVRNNASLGQAVQELGLAIPTEESAKIVRRGSFQRMLWEQRHRYFSELGRDPNFTKETAIGKLIQLAQKLEEEGENDKAAEVILKLAKVNGWVGPESTVSVFGELSSRDLDAIREQIETKQKVQ